MRRLGLAAAMAGALAGILSAQEVETRPEAPAEAPAEALAEAPAGAPADAAAIPARVPPERYQTLWERSPFEIPVAAESSPVTGIRAEWLLTSLSRSGGKPFAILVSKGTGESVVIRQGEEGAHGFTLVDAVIAQDFKNSRATVRRGAESAELQFQEQELATLVSAAPQAQAAPAPSPPGTNPGVRPNQSRFPPPPAVRPTAPGIPSAAPNPSTPQPPRRIIRRPDPVTPPASKP